MIYADCTFPYEDYRGKGHLFETYAIDEYEDEDDDYTKIRYQIDYSETLGMYRVTRFRDNHWNGDIVFDECKPNHNAYCPICDAGRWIPDMTGYCCKCGHHLNRLEECRNGIDS